MIEKPTFLLTEPPRVLPVCLGAIQRGGATTTRTTTTTITGRSNDECFREHPCCWALASAATGTARTSHLKSNAGRFVGAQLVRRKERQRLRKGAHSGRPSLLLAHWHNCWTRGASGRENTPSQLTSNASVQESIRTLVKYGPRNGGRIWR